MPTDIAKYGVFKLPEESVETNPVAWWKYCFEVTRTEIRKKMKQWNWDNMKKLLAARTSYIAIYKKLVKTPELITPEEQELVDNVHKVQDDPDNFLNCARSTHTRPSCRGGSLQTRL